MGQGDVHGIRLSTSSWAPVAGALPCARCHLRRLASPGKMLLFWGWPKPHHQGTNQIARLMSICTCTLPEWYSAGTFCLFSCPTAFNPPRLPPEGDIRSNKEENVNGRDGNTQDRPSGRCGGVKQEEIKELGRTLMTESRGPSVSVPVATPQPAWSHG